MIRMLSRRPRPPRAHFHARALAILAGSLAIASSPAGANAQPQPQGAPRVSVKAVAAQLGVRLGPRDDDDLNIGASFTASLDDPEKLAAFGIKGMHQGARVTVFRAGADKVRVEADEMEPVAARGAATLKVDAKGALTAAEKG